MSHQSHKGIYYGNIPLLKSRHSSIKGDSSIYGSKREVQQRRRMELKIPLLTKKKPIGEVTN